MSEFAVRYTQPLLGAASAAGYLVAVPGVSVLIRQDGVACDVFADNDKTPMDNPVPTGVPPGTAGVDTTGNLTIYLEPGRGYSAVATVGATSSTFAIPDISLDPEEPIPAGAVSEAMLAFGVATQAELNAVAAAKQDTIPSGTYVEPGENLADLVDTEEARANLSAAPLDYPAGKAALRPFWTALAARSTTPVDIVAIGTSITEGEGALTRPARWVNRITDRLRATFQPAGIPGGEGYVPFQYAVPNLPDAWTLVGGLIATAWGLGRRSVQMTAAANLTGTFRCTSFDIFYAGGATTGTFTVTIDGGAPVTVNTVNGSTQDGLRWSSGALTRGNHTIVVAWASGTVHLTGAFLYDGDESLGIRMWEGGHSGHRASNYASSHASWGVLDTIQPDLVFIEIGANDVSNQVALPTFEAGVLDMIVAVRAHTTIDPGIALIAVWNRQDAEITAEMWQPYYDVLKDIAAADAGVVFIDEWARFGAAVGDPFDLFDDQLVHPNVKGSQYLADTIAEVVAPVTGADVPAPPYPSQPFINVLGGGIANSNWASLAQSSTRFFGADLNSTGAQNAEVSFDAVVGPGTWTLDLFIVRATDGGIMSIYFDGSLLGTTVDQYAGATAAALASVAGIVVTAGGLKRLRFVMTDKNASSSSYKGRLSGISLRKTA